eukprot:TRINITY_DN15748_c0_g1_i1.p1 TRINITY_DN15748_c0_g1~~TRINITY_DN15748_c0_g1_i1.p1  ORF type:complete len:626 (+),score=196.02 TRINITY_DN15748_c0_g1_i1:41-1879(+)
MAADRQRGAGSERLLRCENRACGCNGIFKWRRDLEYHLNPISFCGGQVKDYKLWLDTEVSPLMEPPQCTVPRSPRFGGRGRYTPGIDSPRSPRAPPKKKKKKKPQARDKAGFELEHPAASPRVSAPAPASEPSPALPALSINTCDPVGEYTFPTTGTAEKTGLSFSPGAVTLPPAQKTHNRVSHVSGVGEAPKQPGEPSMQQHRASVFSPQKGRLGRGRPAPAMPDNPNERAALWFQAAVKGTDAVRVLEGVPVRRRSIAKEPPPGVVSREQYEAMLKGYQQLDTDGSGDVSAQEVVAGCEAIGLRFDAAQQRKLEQLRSGAVDFDELLAMFFPELPATQIARYRRQYARRDREPTARDLLEPAQLREIDAIYSVLRRQHSADGSGLPWGSLRAAAPSEITDEELAAMFHNCDADGDGSLSREEFSELVKFAFPPFDPQRLSGFAQKEPKAPPKQERGAGRGQPAQRKWQDDGEGRVKERYRRVRDTVAQLRRQRPPVARPLPPASGATCTVSAGFPKVRGVRRAQQMLLGCTSDRRDGGSNPTIALPPTPPGGHVAHLHGKISGGAGSGRDLSSPISPRSVSQLPLVLGPRPPPALPQSVEKMRRRALRAL